MFVFVCTFLLSIYNNNIIIVLCIILMYYSYVCMLPYECVVRTVYVWCAFNNEYYFFMQGTMILLLSSLVVSQSLTPHRRSLQRKSVVRWIVADRLVWLFVLCFPLASPVSDATLQL